MRLLINKLKKKKKNLLEYFQVHSQILKNIFNVKIYVETNYILSKEYFFNGGLAFYFYFLKNYRYGRI